MVGKIFNIILVIQIVWYRIVIKKSKLLIKKNNYQVPAELKDKKADLEAAIKDFAASYQTKADELKKDAPNLEAATASFTQAEEKLGKVFESEKLLPPSIDKQVN
jgi:hypothetical protein